MPPAGQKTQIGNAGATSHGLAVNDDLFVSGQLEVDGIAYFDNDVRFYDTFYCNAQMYLYSRLYMQAISSIGYLSEGNALFNIIQQNEEVTIAIGTGAAGVNTTANLAVADSIIIAAAVRVTQAPGGGATEFDLGRTGGNLDEYIDGLAIALGTTGTSIADGDGVNLGSVHNGPANTFTLTTDANVTIADMKVRICVWYHQITPPTS